MSPADHLIIFSRFPKPGKTKTRLIPVLGPVKAAKLQQLMTERIVSEALKLKKTADIQTTIFYTGGTQEEMSRWLGNSFAYRAQSNGDIGERMHHAFTSILRSTTGSIILVGSDIPKLTVQIITDGFASLARCNCVLGPSLDGGYYLIGMKAECATELGKTLFKQMKWSTDSVLNISVKKIMLAGMSYSLLPALCDIDDPRDIAIARELRIL